MVSGDAPAARVAAYRAQTRAGMHQVAALWGADVWRGRPVRVQVPATLAQFTRLTGSSAPAVSAVTTPRGVIVVRPTLWDQTSAEGRQVVITHELTHVALGQSGLQHVPLWVIEGSAELTAYRSTGLDLAHAAPALVADVAAGRVPPGPPADAGLLPETATSLTEGYHQAYAWCAYLVVLRGTADFTTMVRAADSGDSTAFQEIYGRPVAALGEGYRSWLRGAL